LKKKQNKQKTDKSSVMKKSKQKTDKSSVMKKSKQKTDKSSVMKKSKQKTDKSSVMKKSKQIHKLILDQLKSHGAKIYQDLENEEFPKFSIPSRSIKNIVYDKKIRQYILGESSTIRSSKNTSQLRSFTQLMWLAFFANKLTLEKKSSTLRDVYYSSQAFAVDFEDQAESDNIIVDLEAVISRPREDFHIFPEERSSIFGDLNIEYTIPGYEGKKMNLSSHPDGYAIGPSLTTAELVSTSADMVIAIEKGGLFTRFVEEQVDKKFKSIIINTGGQAPRSTRTLLKRLHDEMGLPVIILTDGDVYGEHIAMVIKSGSANAAHLRELTVPDAKWVGVWATDIEKYKLPTIPMTDSDIKRCYDLQKDPRYQEGIWKKELQVFLKIKRKAELEAFSKYGLTNITDKYLPVKIEESKSL
jgi:DNA topoisomerase-6 subunit A